MRNLLLTICVMFLYGCATIGQPKFHVSVDSLASPKASKQKTYILLPANKGVTWDDLQFQEYAIQLMRVLGAQGYISAKSADDADLAITLAYGIGEPQKEQYSYSLPTWGQTGVSSSNTYGTASTFGNVTTINATTTHTPTYGITGHETYIGTRTTFFRYALVTGYDYTEFKKSNKQKQIWKTTVTSTGSSGDLRQVFPVLMGAAIPYLATNTTKKVSVTLYESDKVVKAVKGLAIE